MTSGRGEIGIVRRPTIRAPTNRRNVEITRQTEIGTDVDADQKRQDDYQKCWQPMLITISDARICEGTDQRRSAMSESAAFIGPVADALLMMLLSGTHVCPYGVPSAHCEQSCQIKRLCAL